jgi:hypothetical protein
MSHEHYSVQYRPVTSYQDAVDALINKIADFGWYGGLTGVQAGLRMPPSSVYIAQGLRIHNLHRYLFRPVVRITQTLQM